MINFPTYSRLTVHIAQVARQNSVYHDQSNAKKTNLTCDKNFLCVDLFTIISNRYPFLPSFRYVDSNLRDLELTMPFGKWQSHTILSLDYQMDVPYLI